MEKIEMRSDDMTQEVINRDWKGMIMEFSKDSFPVRELLFQANIYRGSYDQDEVLKYKALMAVIFSRWGEVTKYLNEKKDTDERNKIKEELKKEMEEEKKEEKDEFDD